MLCFQAIAKLTASYIRNTLPQLHKAHSGISDAQAEIEYLKVQENIHIYLYIYDKITVIHISRSDWLGAYAL